MNQIMTAAKAIAALLGSVLTAIIATAPSVPTWVAIAAAVCTAVATWAIPNAPAKRRRSVGAKE